MSQTKTLSSFDEALAFLTELKEMTNKDTPTHFIFEGELSNLQLHFEGDNYHGSLPSGCIKGLWEYQQALYKGLAAVLYDADDIRRLNKKDLQNFELVYEVNEGTTSIKVDATGFMNSLGEGLISMESSHLALTIVSVALVLTLGWAGTRVLLAKEESKQKKIAADVDAQREQARTDQLKVFGDAINENARLQKFVDHNTEGTRNLIKYSTGADKISVGKVDFDSSEIEEISQRSSRSESTAKTVIEDFVIVRTETRDAGITKLLLSNKEGEEFTAIMEDSDFEEDELQKVWLAIRNRKKISLEVTITRSGEAVKKAQVISIKA